MSSLEEKKFLRLIKFSRDLSSKVCRAFTESNILSNHNNSFSDYLTNHKHNIYHLYQVINPCCRCIGAVGFSSRRHLYKEQFYKLFLMNGVTNPNHVKRNRHNNNIVIKHCICNVTVNPSCCLDDLDITLIHTLIRNCERSLPPDDADSLTDIKDVRNFLAHSGSTSEIQLPELEDLWKKLETAVLALASKVPQKFYKESIKDAISYLKVIEFSEEVISELNSKYNQMKEELNELHDRQSNNEEIFKELSNNLSTNQGALEGTVVTLEEKVCALERKVGELTTIIICQVLTEKKEKQNRSLESHEYRTVDVSCQVDGENIDFDLAVAELSKREETHECFVDKFDIKDAKKGSLLLDLSASPDVLRSPETLKAAIRDLTELIIKAGNVDTNVPGNLHIKLIFKSPLTEDELQVIQTVFSNRNENKENEPILAGDLKTNMESETGGTQHTEESLSTFGDTYIRNYSDSDSDDSPVYVARDPMKDRHFGRKRELLWNCKGKVGKISEHRKPLTIAVIGPPGAGKSSFLNTVFAAFSNDHWEEYVKYGEFGEKGKRVTIRLKSFKKRDYYKEKDDYLMPTFLDMTGFEDDSSPLNKELLNIVLCGKLKEGEELSEIIDQGNNFDVRAVHEKYFGEKYFGIIPKMNGKVSFLSRILDLVAIPNREEYHRVNRIIVVCSANPNQPLPVSLFDSITDVTNRERDITLYGVLTHADRHKSRDGRVAEREKAFMKALGIPKTRFARIKNYCPDIYPFLTYEDTIIPSLDVPVLRLMRQACITC